MKPVCPRKTLNAARRQFPTFLTQNLTANPETRVTDIITTFCELWGVEPERIAHLIDAPTKARIQAEAADRTVRLRQFGRTNYAPTLDRQERHAFNREVARRGFIPNLRRRIPV